MTPIVTGLLLLVLILSLNMYMSCPMVKEGFQGYYYVYGPRGPWWHGGWRWRQWGGPWRDPYGPWGPRRWGTPWWY